jgi:hypothetical protein
VGVVSAGLACGPDEDLVDRQPTWPGYSEGNDLGDVLGGDGQLLVQTLGALFGLYVRDVFDQLRCDGAGLDDGDPDVGLQLLAQRASDQPLIPHFVAAYAALPARAVRPATEEMFTRSPPPSRSWSRNTSVVVNEPSRLTSTICRISVRWSEVKGASSMTPA